MKNRNIIHQRRESIMSNSESVEINKSKIFYKYKVFKFLQFTIQINL